MTKHAIDNIINAIANLVLEAADDGNIYLFSTNVVFGPELPSACISMTPGPGAPIDVHLDKGMVYRLPIVINGKYTDQEQLLQSLYAIHELLTKKLDYSDLFIDELYHDEASADYQVADIETTASPSLIGREQDKYWLAGSSIEVKFYWFIKNN